MTEINKTDDIIIRISENEYQDHKYIDIRQYYKDDNGEFKPTKKGITFPPDLLEDVIEGLQKIKREFEENCEDY